MKKLIFSLLIFGGVAFLGTTAVNAQEKKPPVRVANSGFTDANGDGLCDSYNGTQPGKGLGPGNGQGLGKADGKGLGLKNGSGNGQRRLDGSGLGQNNGNGRQDGSRGRCQPSVK